MGTFVGAGEDLIGRLEVGLYGVAKGIMRDSLILCPLSDGTTYIEEWGTKYRTINGRVVKFDDPDDYIVGDEGTLRRSARVFPPVRAGDTVSVELGYGFGEEVNPAGRLAAEYAVPVHERSELRHDPPTQSHYLLDPLLAKAAEMGTVLAATADVEVAVSLVEVEGADLMEGTG